MQTFAERCRTYIDHIARRRKLSLELSPITWAPSRALGPPFERDTKKEDDEIRGRNTDNSKFQITILARQTKWKYKDDLIACRSSLHLVILKDSRPSRGPCSHFPCRHGRGGLCNVTFPTDYRPEFRRVWRRRGPKTAVCSAQSFSAVEALTGHACSWIIEVDSSVHAEPAF